MKNKMRKPKNWIAGALSGGKNKGALRRTAMRKGLLRNEDEKLSMTDLKKLEKVKGTTGKRAYLAETLRKFDNGGVGGKSEQDLSKLKLYLVNYYSSRSRGYQYFLANNEKEVLKKLNKEQGSAEIEEVDIVDYLKGIFIELQWQETGDGKPYLHIYSQIGDKEYLFFNDNDENMPQWVKTHLNYYKVLWAKKLNYVNTYANGGGVGKFNLVYEISSKMMGGDGVSGSIRTTPENYYVATIDSNGDILFEDIEAMTKDIDKAEVEKLWLEKEIPVINNYVNPTDDGKKGFAYAEGGVIGDGDIVKWKDRSGTFAVTTINDDKVTATIKEILNPDADYKGSYVAELSDLELVQKYNNGGSIVEPSRYEFKRKNGEGDVNELYVEYEYKPTKSEVISDLKYVKSRFKEGSEYANFSPVVVVVYPYTYGWERGYKAHFSSDNDFDVDRLFYDESKGARNIYYLDVNKMAKGGRIKSALMRDRKYKSQEPHEQSYTRMSRPKNKHYKKQDLGWFANGGGVGNVTLDIQKAKTALIKKAKSKGIYENFGQMEAMVLEDKYGAIPEVNEFDNWVLNFDLDKLSQYAKGGLIVPDDLVVNDSYKYLHTPNTTVQYLKKIGDSYIFTDKNGDWISINQDELASSVAEINNGATKFKKLVQTVIKENLWNNEIAVDVLTRILGHEPNYPYQIAGGMKLEKSFLRPYYRLVQ